MQRASHKGDRLASSHHAGSLCGSPARREHHTQLPALAAPGWCQVSLTPSLLLLPDAIGTCPQGLHAAMSCFRAGTSQTRATGERLPELPASACTQGSSLTKCPRVTAKMASPQVRADGQGKVACWLWVWEWAPLRRGGDPCTQSAAEPQKEPRGPSSQLHLRPPAAEQWQGWILLMES